MFILSTDKCVVGCGTEGYGVPGRDDRELAVLCQYFLIRVTLLFADLDQFGTFLRRIPRLIITIFRLGPVHGFCEHHSYSAQWHEMTHKLKC